MPDLVAFEEMPAAVTLGSLSLNISRAVGPAIAGTLIAAFGPAACFSLNALSFLGVLLTLWRWHPEKKPAPLRSERFLGALSAACRYAAHAPAMQTVLVRAIAFFFFGVAVTALLPIQATHRLHLPASEFGLLMGGFWLRRYLHGHRRASPVCALVIRQTLLCSLATLIPAGCAAGHGDQQGRLGPLLVVTFVGRRRVDAPASPIPGVHREPESPCRRGPEDA